MHLMALIYKTLAAFARDSEVWACLVKQSSHHIRLTLPLKNDSKLAIHSPKRAAECGTSFDQFLKPMDIFH